MAHAVATNSFERARVISLGPWCKTYVRVKQFTTFDRFMNLWLNNSNMLVSFEWMLDDLKVIEHFYRFHLHDRVTY